VTLAPSRRSIEFFKREADKQRAPYQRMIRALLDEYTRRMG
jgi:predicted DNA binding CopG/RHH family protein